MLPWRTVLRKEMGSPGERVLMKPKAKACKGGGLPKLPRWSALMVRFGFGAKT